MARVNWQLGLAQDQLTDDQKPWHPILRSSHDTAFKQMGFSGNGLVPGSKVVGLACGGDAQDIIILGSCVRQGNSALDDPNPSANSEIPQGAKQQQNGNMEQPMYGDVAVNVAASDTGNPQPRNQSVVTYAQNEGGNQQVARYWPLDDSVGYMSVIA